MRGMLVWFLFGAFFAYAQPPAAPGNARGQTPAAGAGGPVLQSPEVLADGRIVFRLRAPNASEVLLRGIAPRPIPMSKNEDGVWTVTTEPLKPDLYEYSFLVDGLAVLDPLNPRVRPAYRRLSQSAVLVPGDVPWSPVPGALRGAVARHEFRSVIAGDDGEFFVYTPPNYDPKRRKPYPVLYLLHGLYDDARAWTEVGAAHTILDTLIHRGEAEPMILVNPLGYGNAEGPAGHRHQDMLPNFVRILMEEVMPRVERHYNVSRRREDTAVAGLSMGGAEAVYAGLNHLERFAWIGSFSGAFNLWPLTRPPLPEEPAGQMPPSPEEFRRRLVLVEDQLPRTFPGLDARANSRIRHLWVSCGTADVLIGVNRQFRKYLDGLGVKVNYLEIPDAGHVWPLWRRNFADFAPLLFKPGARK